MKAGVVRDFDRPLSIEDLPIPEADGLSPEGLDGAHFVSRIATAAR
jgi:hypothetical protein